MFFLIWESYWADAEPWKTVFDNLRDYQLGKINCPHKDVGLRAEFLGRYAVNELNALTSPP